jgi:pyruvate kinase
MPSVATLAELLEAIRALHDRVVNDAHQLSSKWQADIRRSEFEPSARNLGAYLALRRHDLTELQPALMRWGLSSLGRSESRVEASLEAVLATLSALEPSEAPRPDPPNASRFFLGEDLIEARATELFGKARARRATRIMVTLPTEAADDLDWMRELVRSGIDCVRINCAHDSPAIWSAMLENLRCAERNLDCPDPVRVLMDLGGPKVRTVRPEKQKKDRYAVGDRLLLCSAPDAGSMPRAKRRLGLPVVGCTSKEPLERLAVGDAVHIDDGKIGARALERVESGVVIEIMHAPEGGKKIRDDKGINFPDTEFEIPSLTDKDRSDLDFVAKHADLVGYSFVQTEADVDALTSELEARGTSPEKPGILLKIETRRAIRNLPSLIIRAAGQRPSGVMIARGDLAIELGFERAAEMQEEILWLCEAAHVPVVWATQVLDALAREGLPTRGEVTDAAMASRAECVMLNKGPHIVAAIRLLDRVLTRMEGHQHKKTPMLRVLHSWESSFPKRDG